MDYRWAFLEKKLPNMSILRKLLFLLSNKEKKKAVLLLIMIFIMALLDMIGVASILPFIALLSNPEIIQTNLFLNKIYNFGNFQNNQDFFMFSGLVVFLILCFSLFFKALTSYFQLRFVLMREYTVSKKLIEGYLHQPYSWFLNRHSSDLGKNILSEVQKVTSGCMLPFMEIIAQSAVVIALTSFLLFTDTILTIVVVIVLGSSYLVIYKLVTNFLNKIGKERLAANNSRYSAVSEAFGAFKIIKFRGLEKLYIKRFGKPAEIFARNQALAQVIERLPRFFLEAIGFGGLLLMIVYFLKIDYDFTSIIPLIALFAFAGYRILPSLQGVYGAFTQLRFYQSALNVIYDDIKNLNTNYLSDDDHEIGHKDSEVNFQNSIMLDNICYTYPNSIKTTLDNITIDIPHKKTVGIIGKTGCGKTSTADLILGLLKPQKGTLKVDNKIINSNNIRSWQSLIGYVPQDIFLIDDTISANIAFGIDPKNYNKDDIERSAKISNIHNFILNELPNGYETFIGERGVKLSGGQRQRIAIARALYHNPSVLIFDEATSSLDNITEKNIMDEVYSLRKKMTIIIIAHRLSTVEMCDKIYLLDQGKIKEEGDFKKLFDDQGKFKNFNKS